MLRKAERQLKRVFPIVTNLHVGSLVGAMTQRLPSNKNKGSKIARKSIRKGCLGTVDLLVLTSLDELLLSMRTFIKKRHESRKNLNLLFKILETIYL